MIIDASVAFKWFVVEEGSDEAIAWVGRAELMAPVLIHTEVANAIRKRVRRGELASAGAGEQLSYLDEVIRTVEETPFLPRAFELALELDHSVYDCVYLALAEAMGEQMLTADEKFIAKATASAHEAKVRSLLQ